MSTYTQILYHIVFSTKNRQYNLESERRQDLFRYIWGVIKSKNSHLYRINGVEDHLHILTSLHPSVCLADFVKDIKVSTSKWIKDEKVFTDFTHWQDGYSAFTHSINEKDSLIGYIKGQEIHHKKVLFIDELRQLLKRMGIEFDEKYLV